jgi:tetratricopeptide (TPR) repeat protein
VSPVVTRAGDYAADTRSDRDQKNREKIISDIDRALRDSASTMEGLSDRTQSRVLTVLLLAIVAPVHAAIIKGTVILNEVGGRPIANVQIIDSAHTGGRWASTLNNLGVLDPDQGQVEEARKQYAEALQIYRALAQEYPETYRPKVAETLNNLGLLDSNHGRVEEAREEYVEALQKARFLASIFAAPCPSII